MINSRIPIRANKTESHRMKRIFLFVNVKILPHTYEDDKNAVIVFRYGKGPECFPRQSDPRHD